MKSSSKVERYGYLIFLPNDVGICDAHGQCVVVLVWLECVCCGRWCSIAVFTAVEPVALSVPVVIEVVVAVEVGDKRR